jgi:two-component system CheB/CheR fusion protein
VAAKAHQLAFFDLDQGRPGRVLGDVVRLEQLVLNLLSNALKFTPSGGRVELRLSRDETMARLDVIDNGQVIAPEFLPYVFDMYRQGLSIDSLHAIVEKLVIPKK